MPPYNNNNNNATPSYEPAYYEKCDRKKKLKNF